MQAAAGFSTLLYLPLKLAFAIGGGIVGGLAYAFSGGNEQAAKSIWTPASTAPTSLLPITYKAIGPSASLGSLTLTLMHQHRAVPAPEPVR